MITYEEKVYYDIDEITSFFEDPLIHTELQSFIDLWYKSEDNPDAVPATLPALHTLPERDGIRFRLMTLVNMKKLTHLECTKKDNPKIFYLFNTFDIKECIDNLTFEERNIILYSFETIKLVEAE